MKAGHPFLVLVLLLPTLTLAQTGGERKQTVSLFSEEEARQLNHSDEEWFVAPTKQVLRNGPIIVVVDPRVELTDKGPRLVFVGLLNLSVRFDEQHAAVDMTSLAVVARKLGIRKDLTDLLQPYISGDELVANDIEVRQGKYKIDISVFDIEGRESSETYLVQVR